MGGIFKVTVSKLWAIRKVAKAYLKTSVNQKYPHIEESACCLFV